MKTLIEKKDYFPPIISILIVISSIIIYPMESVFIVSLLGILVTIKFSTGIGAILAFLCNIFLLRGFEVITNSSPNILHVVSFYLFPFFVLFLFSIIKKKQVKVYLHPFNLSIVLFFLMMLFSTVAFSTSKNYGFEKLLYYTFTLIGCFVLNLVVNERKDVKKLFYAIHIFGVILLSLCFVSLFSPRMHIGKFYFGRFSTLGINPIWVARYLSYSIISNLFLLYTYRNKVLSIVYLSFVSIAQFIFMLATGSRAPLLGFIVSIMIIIVYKTRFNIKKLLIIAMVFILIVGFVISISEADFLERFSGSQSSKKSSLSRVVAQYQAYELFRQNVIFGGGFGSFDKYFLKYPHNLFTEITSEMGLLGLLALIIMITITVKNIKRINLRNLDNLLLIGLLAASFVNTNLSGHVGNNVFFWLILYLVNHTANLSKSDSITHLKSDKVLYENINDN